MSIFAPSQVFGMKPVSKEIMFHLREKDTEVSGALSQSIKMIVEVSTATPEVCETMPEVSGILSQSIKTVVEASTTTLNTCEAMPETSCMLSQTLKMDSVHYLLYFS